MIYLYASVCLIIGTITYYAGTPVLSGFIMGHAIMLIILHERNAR